MGRQWGACVAAAWPSHPRRNPVLNSNTFRFGWLHLRGRICVRPHFSAMSSACAPRRRLLVNTKSEKLMQKPGATIDDSEADEKAGARRLTYLVTVPHPKVARSACRIELAISGKYGTHQIFECVLGACKAPVYTDARSLSWGREVHLKQAAVFEELHAPDATGLVHAHSHVPALAQPKRIFRSLPVKKALLTRHGLAARRSCTLNGCWPASPYCCVQSPKQPQGSLDTDPVLWSRDGLRPALRQCREEPLTAKALEARSESAYQKARADGKSQKFSELDVWPVVAGNYFITRRRVQRASRRSYWNWTCGRLLRGIIFTTNPTTMPHISS